jgi:hypothetical protein
VTRCRWARAYRGGGLVCGRVEVTIEDDDDRVGLARHERRYVEARFLERLDPELRDELAELVRRRGMAARRAAEHLEPIEIVVDDPRRGRQRLAGRLEPPRLRVGELREIGFGLRELEPAP